MWGVVAITAWAEYYMYMCKCTFTPISPSAWSSTQPSAVLLDKTDVKDTCQRVN